MPIVTAAANSMRRGPKRSVSRPAGICIPAYTASWIITKTPSWADEMPKRATASGPATPSVLRLNTASE